MQLKKYLKNTLKNFNFLFFILIFSLSGWSQQLTSPAKINPSKTTPPKTSSVDKVHSQLNSKSNVLDFGADVIEGELKKPQLFVELGANIDDMTSIIHLRDNFNDFHAVDQKRRLRFIKK